MQNVQHARMRVFFELYFSYKNRIYDYEIQVNKIQFSKLQVREIQALFCNILGSDGFISSILLVLDQPKHWKIEN